MPIIISLKRLREGYVHGSTSNIVNVVIMMHGYLDLDVKFLSTSVCTTWGDGQSTKLWQCDALFLHWIHYTDTLDKPKPINFSSLRCPHKTSKVSWGFTKAQFWEVWKALYSKCYLSKQTIERLVWPHISNRHFVVR